MSLRTRVFAAVIVVAAASVGASSLVVSVVVARTEQQQLDDALRSAALREAARAAVHAEAIESPDGSSPSADDVGPTQHYAVLYDDSGQIRMATPSLAGRVPSLRAVRHSPWTAFDLALGAERFRCVLAPVPSTRSVLLLAAPRTDLDGDKRFLLRVHAVVFVISLAIAALLARWISGRLVRDLRRITSTVVRVSEGDLSVRVGSVAHDREIGQLAAHIDAMVAKLGDLVASQQRFIASAAHELRSPLTALYGELTLALRRDRDASEYRKTIEEAVSAAEHLVKLAEDLLAVARLAGAPMAETGPLNVASVARDAVESLRAHAQRRGVTVVFDGDGGGTVGRASDVQRLVRNLVENAIEHTPRNGSVRVAVEGADAYWELRVEDDGPGIADEDRERVFEPFIRGTGSSSRVGSGLGLTIVREIARAHGWEVTIREPRGTRGAAFVMRVPAVEQRHEVA